MSRPAGGVLARGAEGRPVSPAGGVALAGRARGPGMTGSSSWCRPAGRSSSVLNGGVGQHGCSSRAAGPVTRSEPGWSQWSESGPGQSDRLRAGTIGAVHVRARPGAGKASAPGRARPSVLGRVRPADWVGPSDARVGWTWQWTPWVQLWGCLCLPVGPSRSFIRSALVNFLNSAIMADADFTHESQAVLGLPSLLFSPSAAGFRRPRTAGGGHRDGAA